MIVVATDIETSGLSPTLHRILSIGMVAWDTKQPFHACNLISQELLIKQPLICGDPFALHMNRDLIARLAKGEAGIDPSDIHHEIATFLDSVCYPSEAVLAGKNFDAFDRRFLEKHVCFEDLPVQRRVLDVGSMYILPSDSGVPSLGTIISERIYPDFLDQAGLLHLRSPEVLHNAVEDAMMVLAALAYYWEC